MNAKATIAAALLLPASLLPVAAQGWTAQGEGGAVVAGSTVEGRLAGLKLVCAGGRPELRLTHNGSAFDRTRAYSVVLSVDGQASVLSMRAMTGNAGDDFVSAPGDTSLAALLDALSAGRAVEVSGPAGRYTLPLTGSSRAIAQFRAGCPGAG